MGITMLFSLLPVFSCGMLPYLTQGNSHSVLPLRGFLWRLPHTFSAGISWWLWKHTLAFCKLFQRPCLWLSGFLPFTPRLSCAAFFRRCSASRSIFSGVSSALVFSSSISSFMDFFLGGLGGSEALHFLRHSFCRSRLCASRFSSASSSSGVRSPICNNFTKHIEAAVGRFFVFQ